MKKRTKEENAAYARELRARKRAQIAALADVPPVAPAPRRSTQSVAPVAPTPCPACAAQAAALAIAQERISSLEAQLAAARSTTAPSHRINTYGKNPCIGVASR